MLFGGRAGRVRHAVGLLLGVALGCGAVNCGRSSADSRGSNNTAEIAPPPIEGGSAGEGDAAPLPMLTKEALAARVEAQRRTLGRGNLFEDEHGIPVEILGEEFDSGGSFEDDLLDSLPGSAGPLGESGASETHTHGNALGLYVPVESASNEFALRHFHDALHRLEAGEDEDGKVRVLIYGASHTQADVYPGYLRSYLQARFGDGGYGHVSLVRINNWFKYLGMMVESKGWKVEHAQRRERRDDGYWGLLGASASSTSKRDFGRVQPRGGELDLIEASRYELAYLGQPGGGKFDLLVDGKPFDTVDTAAQAPTARHFEFELEQGAHSIEIRPRSDKEVRVFGLVLERQEPGVVVDTLGISGTRAANLLKWDEEQWTAAVRRRNPDLYALAYGTNESTDLEQPIGTYRARLIEVLRRFRRAVPDASCLLIGPGDVPRQVEEGVWVPRPRLGEIIEVQREVALDAGCGFWDTRAFMGGVNSMHEWATSRPQMASRDHVHLTRRGYVRLGMALTDAIMAEFDAG